MNCHMSIRIPAKSPKSNTSPKIAANDQRGNQPVIRSASQSYRSVPRGSPESPSRAHTEPKQETPPIQNPATALQDRQPAMRVGFDLSSATANVRAYQAMLQRTSQVNMQFVFEFFRRLATIK